MRGNYINTIGKAAFMLFVQHDWGYLPSAQVISLKTIQSLPTDREEASNDNSPSSSTD